MAIGQLELVHACSTAACCAADRHAHQCVLEFAPVGSCVHPHCAPDGAGNCAGELEARQTSVTNLAHDCSERCTTTHGGASVVHVDRSERPVETQHESSKPRIGRQQVRAEPDHSDCEVSLFCPSQHRQEGRFLCRLCQVLRQTARADRRIATKRHVRDHSCRQRAQLSTARAI